MADKVKASWFKVSTNTMCNTLKQHTKYAHTVRGRPTLKDVERFRNGSVRKLYERSLYERTFMSERIENHAISKVSNVDLNKHRRGFRRDPEEVGQQFAKHHGAKCSARHFQSAYKLYRARPAMDALQPQEAPCRHFEGKIAPFICTVANFVIVFFYFAKFLVLEAK